MASLDRDLDLALRVHADVLEELADAHVEGVRVHGCLRQAGVVIATERVLERVLGERVHALGEDLGLGRDRSRGACGSPSRRRTARRRPATRSSFARSAMRISISLLSMKVPVFCVDAVMCCSSLSNPAILPAPGFSSRARSGRFSSRFCGLSLSVRSGRHAEAEVDGAARARPAAASAGSRNPRRKSARGARAPRARRPRRGRAR